MVVAPITNEEIARIRQLVSEQGETKARELLGLARPAFARVLAGLHVRKGNTLIVRTALAALGSEVSSPP